MSSFSPIGSRAGRRMCRLCCMDWRLELSLPATHFTTESGDALLLWSPPANAHQALRSTLLRWVGLEHLFKPSEDVKSAAEYIRQLEQGLLLKWRDINGRVVSGGTLLM